MGTTATKKKPKPTLRLVKPPTNGKGDGAADFTGDIETVASRPTIFIPEFETDDLVQRVIRLVIENNQPLVYFNNRGGVADIRNLALRDVDTNAFTKRLVELAYWRGGSEKSPTVTIPDARLVNMVLFTDELADRLPAIDGITACPVFAADGSFVTAPGYNAGTRTFYAPAPGFEVPEVPEQPTDAQVEAARDLLYYMVADFPFVADVDRSNAIGMLVSGFIRPMLDGGDIPMFVFSAPDPGTGKGLLANVITIAISGQPLPVSVETSNTNPDEQKKALFSLLREGAPVISFDNLHQRIQGAALNAVLTGGGLKERVLGQSKVVFAPNRSILVGTGNNIEASAETIRRLVMINLADPLGQPLLRTKFQEPDLPRWVRENRARLVGAVATLVRNWIVKGRPNPKAIRPSYEPWARVVGGTLEAAGVPEFDATYVQYVRSVRMDTRETALRQFVARWAVRFGTKEVTVGKDLYPLLEIGSDLVEGGKSEAAQRQALGILIRKRINSRFGEWFVRESTKTTGGSTWYYLERAMESREGGAA